MSNVMDEIFHIVLIGVGATAVMDLWLFFLSRLGVPTINFALLGRWVGHMFRGTWFHDGVGKSTPIGGEVALGWLAHYVIGIGFSGLMILVFGMGWVRNPTLLPAFGFGVATVIAPLFIMQPAMGLGIASSKTAMPLRNCLKSLANHSVFGMGLFLAAYTLSLWF